MQHKQQQIFHNKIIYFTDTAAVKGAWKCTLSTKYNRSMKESLQNVYVCANVYFQVKFFSCSSRGYLLNSLTW